MAINLEKIKDTIQKQKEKKYSSLQDGGKEFPKFKD